MPWPSLLIYFQIKKKKKIVVLGQKMCNTIEMSR